MAEALSIPDSVRAVDAHAYRRHVVGFFALAATECRGGQLFGEPLRVPAPGADELRYPFAAVRRHSVGYHDHRVALAQLRARL